MELRQLEYLVAVVEEASFTGAADRVHVAQSGVSAQIRRLERELGEPLLDRSGRTVRMTDVGAAVLPHARAALEAVARVRDAVDARVGLVHGHVTVGTVPAIASGEVDLPELLAGFRARHPGVDITLSEGPSADLIEALRAGRLDLAFVGLPATAPEGIGTQVLVDDPLVAAVGRGDTLARRDSVRLAALRDRALISLPRGTGIRALLDEGCAKAGFEPHIAFEASSPPLLAQLAARGLGVAILPRSAVEARPSELHAVAITRPALRGRLALAWREEGSVSPAARALVAHARKRLGAED